VTFGEDAATSRTGSGPANLATIRAAIIAAVKDAGSLHVPEGRRDHTTPPRPSASTDPMNDSRSRELRADLTGYGVKVVSVTPERGNSRRAVMRRRRLERIRVSNALV
jgi:hypothetical protein